MPSHAYVLISYVAVQRYRSAKEGYRLERQRLFSELYTYYSQPWKLFISSISIWRSAYEVINASRRDFLNGTNLWKLERKNNTTSTLYFVMCVIPYIEGLDIQCLQKWMQCIWFTAQLWVECIQSIWTRLENRGNESAWCVLLRV